MLINKSENTGLRDLNDFKAFIGYSNDMDDIYKHAEEGNLIKKQKIPIVFGDMIGHIFSNRKLNPIVTELFIRGRKLNIFVRPDSLILLHQKILTKFYTIFYYESPKQRRISTNPI